MRSAGTRAELHRIQFVGIMKSSGEEWLRQEGVFTGSVNAKPNPRSLSPGTSVTPLKPRTAIGKPTDLSDLDTSADTRARISFDATHDLDGGGLFANKHDRERRRYLPAVWFALYRLWPRSSGALAASSVRAVIDCSPRVSLPA